MRALALMFAGILLFSCSSNNDNSDWRDNCISEDKYPQAKQTTLVDAGYTCWKSGEEFSIVYTFADKENKDVWMKLVQAYDVDILSDGDDWAELDPMSLAEATNG